MSKLRRRAHGGWRFYWALLKDPSRLSDDQLAVLHELRTANSVLYRSWQLKEGLRDLCRDTFPPRSGHGLPLERTIRHANRVIT